MFELAPFSGWGNLNRLRRDMDDLWSRFYDTGGTPATRGEALAYVPSVNVKETDQAFEVSAEVPGIKPEDIQVTLSDGVLSIKGEKKEEKEETKGDYHVVERRFGSFQRSFRLPRDVDPAKIAAKHKDGVLNITLPKAAKAAATTIQVKGE
jgi:HSP20 family protein